MNELNLAATCGVYCGSCRHYLVLKKNLLEKKGLKRGFKRLVLRIGFWSRKNYTHVQIAMVKFQFMMMNVSIVVINTTHIRKFNPTQNKKKKQRLGLCIIRKYFMNKTRIIPRSINEGIVDLP